MAEAKPGPAKAHGAVLLLSPNLVHDPVFSVPRGDDLSLPELLAAMSRGDVALFPALRPHQRPAWHMFLVQLGALALSHNGRAEPVEDTEGWLACLRQLTAGDDAWRLVGADASAPAFMQPPAPSGLKWTETATPDALDMLITARNHDLKRALNRKARAEEWVYALVSLQTCEGYGGRGHPGIARMNGGSSSRPMLGLAPVSGRDYSIHASAHWRRDVLRLLQRRAGQSESGPGRPDGPALLWLLPWSEGEQLDVRDLDPWFIEVCRRVRLVRRDDRILAECANASGSRINGRPFKGVVGDPWAPVTRGESERKSLTIGRRGFHYEQLCELLFSGDWDVPFLAQRGPGESGEMLLLAEAIARGNSKTEGFQSRIVPMPASARRLAPMTVGRLAAAQQKEIKGFDRALRNALVLLPARGDANGVTKDHYRHTNAPRRRFDQMADQLFFPALWRRAASQDDPDKSADARLGFLRDLKAAADTVLEASLPDMPCPVIHRLRAEARARRRYVGTLRRDDDCSAVFEEEDSHVNECVAR